MELTVNKSALVESLLITQSIVQKKTPMPILTHVLLSAGHGSLKISATDLEMTAISTVQANVSEVGNTTVNGRMLFEVIKELPDGDVKITLLDGERLEITAAGAKLKLVGVSAEEYPSLPINKFDAKGKIDGKMFADMISKVIYAVSPDDAKINLSGVCFEVMPGSNKDGAQLRMVATDGFRIAVVTRPASKLATSNMTRKVIIPKRSLIEIKRLLENYSGDVSIDITANFFILETANVKLATSIIDSDFPDYEKAIPTTKGDEAVLDSRVFSEALRRVSLLVSDKSKWSRLDYGNNRLVLSGSSPELGESKEELEVEYKSKNLSIGFNCKYLLDFVNTIADPCPVVMELHGEKGACKLAIQGDDSSFGIIMPLRLP